MCFQLLITIKSGIHSRYFFITVLRDPIHRYLSEFRHVQRGATWKSARHWCGGQEFTSLPHCYKVVFRLAQNENYNKILTYKI